MPHIERKKKLLKRYINHYKSGGADNDIEKRQQQFTEIV